MDPLLLCSACAEPASQDETGKFLCVSMSCPNRRHYSEVNLSSRAQDLIQAGYKQVSRKFCTVARVQNLGVLSKPHFEAYCEFGEDYYLRVYATDRLTLEPELFEEFRKLGGQVA